jgi:uncharacterized protein (DUF2147 family)
LFRQLETTNASFCPHSQAQSKHRIELMLHRQPTITKTALAASAVLLAACGLAHAADPTGDWRVADGVANIRVAQCGGSMWGVVAWEKQPGGRDGNNPDVSKRSRPTLGMPILLDMKRKPGADSWEGQVYNAKDGKTYSSSITPVDADHLEIRGCVLGFLCGGETWTRVAPPIPSSPANSMAKGTKSNARTAATTGTAEPKTTGSIGAPKKPGDQVGDICLLGDVARLAH